MRILVTGATGFIGSAFARLSLSHGHEIAGMMLPTETPPAHVPVSEKMNWLKGTLAELPWREIEKFSPEVCVHFAWIATPGVYLESPENEDYLRWSLDMVRRLRGIGTNHIVGVGTCIEYKITDAPLNEDRTPVDPTTLYSRCKNSLRETLAAEALRDGYSFCWGRIFYPYGVGEHPARLCSALIQKLGRGEKLVLKTPTSTKDYIYVEDLAAAILLTVEKKFTGTINWGTGVGISVRQIADQIAAMLGRPELVEDAQPPQVDPLGFVVADATKLHGLGWQAEHTLKRGLEKMLAAR
ncbi:MAG: NAD(P)-dependent oxidoreductase [Pedosphaera sp.]|nr:NAD(P)-dependent oxidoreductase [Pedosphaera sp.]